MSKSQIDAIIRIGLLIGLLIALLGLVYNTVINQKGLDGMWAGVLTALAAGLLGWQDSRKKRRENDGEGGEK